MSPSSVAKEREKEEGVEWRRVDFIAKNSHKKLWLGLQATEREKGRGFPERSRLRRTLSCVSTALIYKNSLSHERGKGPS